MYVKLQGSQVVQKSAEESYSTTVVCPVYYQIIQRRGNGWAFKDGEPFLNLFNAPNLSPEDEFAAFETSMKKVAIALFCINGGKQGYYIANIWINNITIAIASGRM